MIIQPSMSGIASPRNIALSVTAVGGVYCWNIFSWRGGGALQNTYDRIISAYGRPSSDHNTIVPLEWTCYKDTNPSCPMNFCLSVESTDGGMDFIL